jgi:hypothetical protein
LGLLLGLLQLLLLIQASALGNWADSLLPVVLLAAALDLLVPALAGFLAARQSGDASSGVGAGGIVGGFGFLTIAITLIVLSAQALNAPHQPCPPYSPRLYIPPEFISGFVIIPLIVLEGLGSMVGGLLGGGIGGLLGGKRRGKPSNARRRNPAGP